MNDSRLAELREKYKDRNLLEELGWGAYHNHSGYTSKAAGEFLNWLCNAAYRAIKAQSQWIPCSDTVDIPDHEIIACDKHGELIIGYLAYQDEQWLCESETEIMYDPIAWMEKPEPYKGEADG